MTVQKATKLDVLEALKKGKSVNEIAEQFGIKTNAVYSHIRRLKQQKLWGGGEQPVKVITVPNHFNPDELLDALLKKVEHAQELEVKVAELEKSDKEKTNIIAALKNEVVALRDELKGRPEQQERIKKIAKSLTTEQIRLSEGAL